MERGRHYIFQLSLQRNPEETKRYVEACFGKSIYSQEYQEKIERKLCVGNHKNCHLLFTKGNSRAREDGLKESETEKNRNKIYTGENELSKIKGKREKRKLENFRQSLPDNMRRIKNIMNRIIRFIRMPFEDLQKS